MAILDAPRNVTASGTVLSFDPVQNAQSYEVFADGVSIGSFAAYVITASATNATVSPSDAVVTAGDAPQFSVSADGTSYKLPTSITVAGTTVNAGSSQTIAGKCTVHYTRTNDTSGSIAFSNVADNIIVSVAGEEIQSGYNVTFSFDGDYNPGDMVISGTGVSARLSPGETKTIVCPQGTLYVTKEEGADPQQTSYSATGGVSAQMLGEADFILTITGDGTFGAWWIGCFAEGTLITLADGSRKAVEDITYEDDLLVWNFYEGKLDSAKPDWIMPVKQAAEYNKLTFANGAELKLIGQGGDVGYHRIYNEDAKCFTHTGVPDTPTGCRTFTDDGSFTELVSQEVIKEPVNYYNIITEKHYNLFTNGILTSCRLSNQYDIENMKYVGESKMSEQEIAEYLGSRYRLARNER